MTTLQWKCSNHIHGNVWRKSKWLVVEVSPPLWKHIDFVSLGWLDKPKYTEKYENMATKPPSTSENTSEPAILKSLPILIIHIHRWLLASSQDQETYRAEWMKDIFCRIKSPWRPSQKKYGDIYSKRTKKEQQALRSGTICRRHWDPNILSKWMKPCQPCLITGLVHISQS